MSISKKTNGLLTINLEALAENYRLFQTHVGTSCNVAAVIKANAYGLGIKPIVEKLKTLSCPLFFVATLEEALELRSIDNLRPIAVLNGLMIGAEKDYIEHNLIPSLNTPSDIQRWQQTALTIGKKLPAIIHFDTGMNRLGLSTEETRTFIENKPSLDAFNIHSIMSHFACPDEKDHPLTQKQADTFSEIAKYFPEVNKSISASSGTFRKKSYHYDMVRAGYSLYGGNPTPEVDNRMKSVISLNTPILQVRECKKGSSIGYNATHIFDKNTRTATIALGYADGFTRSNSSKAVLYYEGQPCPALGRVSMDLVSIDISNIKGRSPEQGTAIEILGPHQSIDDLAKSAGTIGYEILTSLGTRYKREYI